MIESWHRIDRGEVLEATRALLPDGGLLVLRGTDQAGRVEAAALVQDFLAADLNYPTVRAHDTTGAFGLKSALLAAWEAVSPSPDPAVVPPWVALAGIVQADEVADHLLRTIEGRGRVGFILEEVDRHQGIGPREVIAVADLAMKAQCPIVVTSRAESRTKWHVDPRATVLALRSFTIEDIMGCLLRAPQMSGRSLVELQEIATFVAEGASKDAVPPAQAYTRVALSVR